MSLQHNLSFAAAMFEQLTCKETSSPHCLKFKLSPLFPVCLVWFEGTAHDVWHCPRRHKSNSVIHYGHLVSSVSMTADNDLLRTCWRFSPRHSALLRISAFQSGQSHSAVSSQWDRLRPAYSSIFCSSGKWLSFFCRDARSKNASVCHSSGHGQTTYFVV